MADLTDVLECSRTAEGTGSIHEGDASRQNGTKRKRSRKGRKSSRPEASSQIIQSVYDPDASGEGREEGENDGQRADSSIKVTSPREDPQARFYENYHKVAEEFDKEFLKKYGEDLDTTLIFAGLFSAVTSAFIIQVDTQLQTDPNADTAALLRVLIYKIDNTTFGSDIPPLPQPSGGPPPSLIHVEAILYMSLVASLFSAFLAMLGKQWLNRYASSNFRGSVVERCRNRQRKFDGIDAWYFDTVLESLPLMLQVSLLLLGCALSRYLWDINITIALVVLLVTSFGLLSYAFVAIAAAASEICPYQTPGSHLIRYMVRRIPRGLASALRSTVEGSKVVIKTAVDVANELTNSLPGEGIVSNLQTLFFFFFILFPTGVYHLGQATISALSTLPTGFFTFLRRVGGWMKSMYFPEERGLDRQATVLDLRCTSWAFQTSLEKPIQSSIIEYLMAIPGLPDFDPTLVTGFFNLFYRCINITNDGEMAIVETVKGLDQLATTSVHSFFRSFYRLSLEDPTSSVLTDLQQQYNEKFPSDDIECTGLPFHSTMTIIHLMIKKPWHRGSTPWNDFTQSRQEHIGFARHMVMAAEIQHKQTQKVSRWILRFVLHSLSLNPSPPASVIIDCLKIVAIDLGCDVSDMKPLDESARLRHVSSLITEQLKTMVADTDKDPILSKRKAICALFPYVNRLEEDEQHPVADSITLLVRAPNFVWH